MERMRSKKAKVKVPRQKLNPSLAQSGLCETHSLRSGRREPPERNFVQRRLVVRRFRQFAAVSNQAFTLANGHDQFLTVTNAATGNAVPYADSWRIHHIDIWAYADAATGSPTTVSLTPVGTDLTSNMNNDPEANFSLTARSPTEPSHMKIVPSTFRPIGGWHFTNNTNTSGTLFQLDIATASANLRLVVMDIVFEIAPNDIGLPLGYSVNTSTFTLGSIGARNILSGMNITGVNNLG